MGKEGGGGGGLPPVYGPYRYVLLWNGVGCLRFSIPKKISFLPPLALCFRCDPYFLFRRLTSHEPNRMLSEGDFPHLYSIRLV